MSEVVKFTNNYSEVFIIHPTRCVLYVYLDCMCVCLYFILACTNQLEDDREKVSRQKSFLKDIFILCQ